jgi:hypothetical protein
VTEPEILGPSPGSLEARTAALKVLAGLNAGVVVLSLFPPPTPMSWLQAVTFNATAGVVAVLYVSRRWPHRRRPGLRGRPAVARVIGVAGLYALGAVVADGRAWVPFDVILAICLARDG